MTFKQIDLNILRRVSEADGIGGCEREVSRIVAEYGAPLCDEIIHDNLGSTIMIKHGSGHGPKVMFSAHMDEVGFMVREITDAGYIKLLPVGGWWGHVMPAHELTVTTMTGEKYIGIVGARAPHGLSQKVKNTVIAPMDLFLDMGVKNRQAILDLGIQIGDMVTPNTKFRVMNDPDLLCGKGWDDRVNLGTMLEVMRNLEGVHTDADLYFAATVQEEVGIRGARTATHTILPDVAVALDVTTATDTPLDTAGMKLGGGLVLSMVDHLTLSNPSLIAMMTQIAQANDLDVRYDFMTDGGTDACNIHKMLDGVVAMTASLPTRYMHSPRLLISRTDYEQTIRLLTVFCQQIDWQHLDGMKQAIGIQAHQ